MGLLALITALLATLWFANIDYRRLIRTDEGRYAEIAREMAESGDWVTPRSNGFKYFYKPPLQYWATAAAFKLFGPNEWTARLWTALTGFLGILFTFWTTRRLWGAEVGLAAAAILAGSLMWVAMGHLSALDMGLAFFLSSAVAAVTVAQRDEANTRERRPWMLVAWAAAAFAVLSKGLIGLVLPAGAFCLYLLLTRDWSRLRALEWLRGGLLFLAITAPWFVAVSLANPEFFHFFFIHEHFERFLTKVHGRYGPPWYFIPVLIAGLLPWTLSIGHALRAGWQRAPSRFQPARFLLAWVLGVFIFFSASSSKLPSYIVPIFPALAVLTALGLRNASVRFRSLQWALVSVLGVVLLASLAVGATPTTVMPLELLARYRPWLIAAGLTLVATGALAFWLERSRHQLAAVMVAALGGLTGTQLILTGHESLSPVLSGYHVARKMLPLLTPDTALFSVDTYDHTLPFYLRRTMTMVAYQDELASGIAWEPAKFLPDYAAFRRAWAASDKAMALMDPREYAAFAKEGLPMQIVVRDIRRVIVQKPSRQGQ